MPFKKKNLVDTNLPLRVQLERVRREKAKRRMESLTSYHAWLHTVDEPNMDWDYPHMEYVASKLDAVARGEIKRLMLLLPYQHGKSSIVTNRWPAYLLERNPKTRIAIGAATADLAHTFSRNVRNLVHSRGIVDLDESRQAVEEWKTREGGGLKAVGVGGQIIGFPVDVMVIDDPVGSYEEAMSKTVRKAVYNWYSVDVYSRQQKDTPIVLIMTHWHEDDLAGRLIAENEDEPDPQYRWTVVKLPALYEGTDPEDYPVKRGYVEFNGAMEGEPLCPELHPLSQLINFRRVMKQMFAAGYQQRPSPEEGNIWKKAWFCEDGDIEKPIKTKPKFPDTVKITQMWDTALEKKERNDPSAMVEGCMYKGIIYVAAMVNEKMEFPELITSMKTESGRYDNVEICAEDKAATKPARQQLRRENIMVIEVPSGTIDKVARAKSVTHYAEGGMVWFVNIPGNCNDKLIDQLLMFDNGRFDDLHDAFVHLLRRLTAGVSGWKKDTLNKFIQSLLKGSAPTP